MAVRPTDARGRGRGLFRWHGQQAVLSSALLTWMACLSSSGALNALVVSRIAAHDGARLDGAVTCRVAQPHLDVVEPITAVRLVVAVVDGDSNDAALCRRRSRAEGSGKVVVAIFRRTRCAGRAEVAVDAAVGARADSRER